MKVTWKSSLNSTLELYKCHTNFKIQPKPGFRWRMITDHMHVKGWRIIPVEEVGRDHSKLCVEIRRKTPPWHAILTEIHTHARPTIRIKQSFTNSCLTRWVDSCKITSSAVPQPWRPRFARTSCTKSFDKLVISQLKYGLLSSKEASLSLTSFGLLIFKSNFANDNWKLKHPYSKIFTYVHT